MQITTPFWKVDRFKSVATSRVLTPYADDHHRHEHDAHP